MHIETVELTDFRSYESLLFNPVPKLNILTGPNAQGKTNLLEGLALLAVGRSFRGAKPLEMTRWGAKSAAVSGEIRRSDVLTPASAHSRTSRGWCLGIDG